MAFEAEDIFFPGKYASTRCDLGERMGVAHKNSMNHAFSLMPLYLINAHRRWIFNLNWDYTFWWNLDFINPRWRKIYNSFMFFLLKNWLKSSIWWVLKGGRWTLRKCCFYGHESQRLKVPISRNMPLASVDKNIDKAMCSVKRINTQQENLWSIIGRDIKEFNSEEVLFCNNDCCVGIVKWWQLRGSMITCLIFINF